MGPSILASVFIPRAVFLHMPKKKKVSGVFKINIQTNQLFCLAFLSHLCCTDIGDSFYFSKFFFSFYCLQPSSSPAAHSITFTCKAVCSSNNSNLMSPDLEAALYDGE